MKTTLHHLGMEAAKIMKQEEYIQGRWYWFEDMGETKGIFRCGKKTSKTQILVLEIYSTNGLMVQTTSIHVYIVKSIATPSQIETCLKAYAEKNGYVNGAHLKQDGVTKILNDKYYSQYWAYDDRLDIGGAHVYSNGKWAEIVAHAPQVQDKQDNALTERIHEYLTNQDLEKMSVLINGHSVSLLKCVEVYQKSLELKDVIG